MAIVYKHTRLDTNNIFYIGIGKTEKRAFSIKNRNTYWHNIINKTEYRVDIVFNDLTWEQACKKEIELIALYGRIDLKLGYLVNMTNGGDGGNGVIFTEERKKELSKLMKGENNPFYGKKHSEETKLIISKKAIGRKTSDKTKEKISNSFKINGHPWTGKHLSIEHKKKLSDAKTGKATLEETKEKLRNNSPRSIVIYRIVNNKLIKYSSMRNAEVKSGISRKIIKSRGKELGFITKEEAIHKGFKID